MANNEIHSEAVQSSIGQSEQLRIKGMCFVLAAVFIILFLRRIFARHDPDSEIVANALVFVTAMLVYECVLLLWARRVTASGKDLPAWMWRANGFLEVFVVGLTLITIGTSQAIPERVLLAPPVAMFFLLIILSALRLEPVFSQVLGLTAAIVYFTATLLVLPSPDFSPITITAAALLALGGVVAGAVSRRLRQYLLAAMREADTKRQLGRIHQELETARGIQQGLLPSRTPDIPGFLIAGWNQPADQTGGDYYDWQSLSDGRIAITLTDVSGHGIAPALVAASCRSYSRLSLSLDSPLAEHMNRINRQLSDDLPPNCFATAVTVILDTKSGDLEILSAGHGPLLLYSSAGDKFTNFDSDGIPLGMVGAYRYPSARKATLNPGDMFVSVTDGFYEWTNSTGEQFGIERIKAFLHTSRGDTPSEIIQALYQEVRQFGEGTIQEDDVTAIIIRRAAQQ